MQPLVVVVFFLFASFQLFLQNSRPSSFDPSFRVIQLPGNFLLAIISSSTCRLSLFSCLYQLIQLFRNIFFHNLLVSIILKKFKSSTVVLGQVSHREASFQLISPTLLVAITSLYPNYALFFFYFFFKSSKKFRCSLSETISYCGFCA